MNVPELTPIVQAASSFVIDVLADDDASHDVSHCFRVMHIATAMRHQIDPQSRLDLEIIQLAAMFHDIEDSKYNGTSERLRDLLTHFFDSHLYPAEKRDQIIDIINHVSYSKEIQPGGGIPMDQNMEFCIVQDADRLDALGAVGIARAFVYGGHVKESLREVLVHLKTKLPDIPPRMKTDLGYRLASERLAFVHTFINAMETQLAFPI